MLTFYLNILKSWTKTWEDYISGKSVKLLQLNRITNGIHSKRQKVVLQRAYLVAVIPALHWLLHCYSLHSPSSCALLAVWVLLTQTVQFCLVFWTIKP